MEHIAHDAAKNDENDSYGDFFHDRLKKKADEYVHLVYALTKAFPKHEIFGVTSQIRRSSLSVVLNYIEGYARRKTNVYRNFLEISYASLKESDYLLDFSLKENYITDIENYKQCKNLSDEIGAMLWATLSKM